jgi:predicted DsbA family dithiol-disulfide isomerase
MQVEIFSDTVCSWCFVGKRRFEKAIAMEPKIDVDIRWSPYNLYPDVPREGANRQAYIKARFGDDADALFKHITEEGAKDGIEFNFDAITTQPNTFDSHRLVEYAHWSGKGNEMMETLFSYFLEQARNIGDRMVLVAAAEETGLDPLDAERILSSQAFADEVVNGLSRGKTMEISSVPCFRINGTVLIEGAHSPEGIAEVLRRYGSRGLGGDSRTQSESSGRIH